jgi:hypothetical protein
MVTEKQEAGPTEKAGSRKALGTQAQSTGPWWAQAPHRITAAQLDALHRRVVRSIGLVETMAVLAERAVA